MMVWERKIFEIKLEERVGAEDLKGTLQMSRNGIIRFVLGEPDSRVTGLVVHSTRERAVVPQVRPAIYVGETGIPVERLREVNLDIKVAKDDIISLWSPTRETFWLVIDVDQLDSFWP